MESGLWLSTTTPFARVLFKWHHNSPHNGGHPQLCSSRPLQWPWTMATRRLALLIAVYHSLAGTTVANLTAPRPSSRFCGPAPPRVHLGHFPPRDWLIHKRPIGRSLVGAPYLSAPATTSRWSCSMKGQKPPTRAIPSDATMRIWTAQHRHTPAP
jgi:hypothetical protein